MKELVLVYEEEALGYGPLAELHNQLASLYEAMLRTQRSHPGYFRVIYHGKGFPELLTRASYVSIIYVYVEIFKASVYLERRGLGLRSPSRATKSTSQYIRSHVEDSKVAP